MRTRERRGAMTYGHGWLRRVAAPLVAVVMLLGVMRAGARYVYCPSMQMVTDAPCCAGDRRAQHEAANTMQLRSRDCCEQHVFARLPPATGVSAAPHLFAAPLIAVLPAPAADLESMGPNARPRFDHEGRAGPIALARHRAELMVSLN
jgi:hypothetical protein